MYPMEGQDSVVEKQPELQQQTRVPITTTAMAWTISKFA
jgi:hypothetical protein